MRQTTFNFLRNCFTLIPGVPQKDKEDKGIVIRKEKQLLFDFEDENLKLTN